MYNEMTRRDFLKLSGVAAVGILDNNTNHLMHLPIARKTEAVETEPVTPEYFREEGHRLLTSEQDGLGIEMLPENFIIESSFTELPNWQDIAKATLKSWELIAKTWHDYYQNQGLQSPFPKSIPKLTYAANESLGTGAMTRVQTDPVTGSRESHVSFGPYAHLAAAANESAHPIFHTIPLNTNADYFHLSQYIEEAASNAMEMVVLTRSKEGNIRTQFDRPFGVISESHDRHNYMWYFGIKPGSETQAISVLGNLFQRYQPLPSHTINLFREAVSSRISFPASYNLLNTNYSGEVLQNIVDFFVVLNNPNMLPRGNNFFIEAIGSAINNGYISPTPHIPRGNVYSVMAADGTRANEQQNINGTDYTGQVVHSINIFYGSNGRLDNLQSASNNDVFSDITLYPFDGHQPYRDLNSFAFRDLGSYFKSYLIPTNQWFPPTPNGSELSISATLSFTENNQTRVKQIEHRTPIYFPTELTQSASTELYTPSTLELTLVDSSGNEIKPTLQFPLPAFITDINKHD